MADILFKTGIAINVIGDLLLMVFAIKYYFAFRQAKNIPLRMEELKAQWASKRKIAFALIIAGPIISIIALSLSA